MDRFQERIIEMFSEISALTFGEIYKKSSIIPSLESVAHATCQLVKEQPLADKGLIFSIEPSPTPCGLLNATLILSRMEH